MRYIFKFPDIGEGITEGKVLEWYVDKGSSIKEGDSIVKVETDKVVADIPSPKSGIIVMRYGKVGEIINVEDPLVEIEIEGVEQTEENLENKEESVEEKGFGVVGSLEIAKEGAFLPASEEGSAVDKKTTSKRKKALATPVARAMAKKLGIDINKVVGTGPVGRVMKNDIQNYFKNTGSTDESSQQKGNVSNLKEILPISQIRKTIAKNMVLSKSTIPHMTVFEEVEISKLVENRLKINEILKQNEGIKLTYLAFIIKSVAKSLIKYPLINSQYDMENGQIIKNNIVNIGIAIDTPEGLVVPVIKNANILAIIEIAKMIKGFSEKAGKRELTMEDMKGGTFTITNYGSIGGIHAVPIINYPQAGILGVGRILDKPIVLNNEVVPGKVLPLSLTVDHRIVDGGESTRFLNMVMQFLENPVLLSVF